MTTKDNPMSRVPQAHINAIAVLAGVTADQLRAGMLTRSEWVRATEVASRLARCDASLDRVRAAMQCAGNSYLERRFVAALTMAGWLPCSDAVVESQLRLGYGREELPLDWAQRTWSPGRMWCAMLPQALWHLPDRKIYIDFAFFANTKRVSVELDGHEFHERTKEQATKDRSRDRQLTLTGWTVLRFTGQEIFRDPDACVAQTLAALRETP